MARGRRSSLNTALIDCIELGLASAVKSLKNERLTADYLQRCQHRLAWVAALYRRRAWADVVREAQEVVELALRALLRFAKVDAPAMQDVSYTLEQNRAALPEPVRATLAELCDTSRSLRRNREFAFYGSEDLTPSDFYKKKDATEARRGATFVVQVVRDAILSEAP